jgi:hypothetical protein
MSDTQERFFMQRDRKIELLEWNDWALVWAGKEADRAPLPAVLPPPLLREFRPLRASGWLVVPRDEIKEAEARGERLMRLFTRQGRAIIIGKEITIATMPVLTAQEVRNRLETADIRVTNPMSYNGNVYSALCTRPGLPDGIEAAERAAKVAGVLWAEPVWYEALMGR